MLIILIRAYLTLGKYALAAFALLPTCLACIASSILNVRYVLNVIVTTGEAKNDYYPFDENTLYRGLKLDYIIKSKKFQQVKKSLPYLASI